MSLVLLALGQAGRHLGRAGLAGLLPCTPRQKILVAALLFLVHATAAAVAHRIVWYGRLLHLYLPFLVLAGVAALTASQWPVAATRAGVAACAVGLVSYILFFAAYQRLPYLVDILAKFKVKCLPDRQLRYIEAVRVPDGLRFRPHRPQMPAPVQCPPTQIDADSSTILVNFALLYPVVEATRATLPTFGPNARLLFDGPYYPAFPAYQFESLAPGERAEMTRRRFRLQVLRLATPANEP
ncbi:MAG: hypothetical protein EOO56_13185 [Hymenobacter sp.]|nr:MAG: hypothetical protein EOO56_13185 [Hymenobacter sp.]